MAQHFYHIPLQQALHFIKAKKSILHRLTTDTKALRYHQQLGKAHYMLQVEAFIAFFKIDKTVDYALNTVEYFNSTPFMTEMAKVLNFSQFATNDTKALFYALCHLYAKEDPEKFEHFMQKSLLHYHSAFNQASNIHIDHQEICRALAKNRKQTIKESFGEEGEGSFFKLFLDGTLKVDERGKRIKTLRKKAYRKLFYLLLDEG